MEYSYKKAYANLDEIIQQIITDIGIETYNKNQSRIRDYITNHIDENSSNLLWKIPCATAFIYYMKNE